MDDKCCQQEQKCSHDPKIGCNKCTDTEVKKTTCCGCDSCTCGDNCTCSTGAINCDTCKAFVDSKEKK